MEIQKNIVRKYPHFWTNIINYTFPHPLVCLGVHTLVQLEVALVRVPLAALVTYVLLPAGVDVPLVRAQVAALAERLAAGLAAVRLLARVHARVQLEAVGVVEALLALRAGEGPLL